MGDGGSGGGGSTDSYIGSLISLTSKCDIRYEGTLYEFDSQKCTITLQDVSSFGTEGRKKDGPQIPASDKVFDFIIFRATDIKDLQVKSSPMPQKPTVSLRNDPAIITLQSEYPRSSSHISSVPYLAGNPVDGNHPGSYSGISAAPIQNSVPSLYQPAGVMSWGAPPHANGNFIKPMQFQGYYRPPSGVSSLQQQPIPLQLFPTLSAFPFSQSQPLQASAHGGLSSALSTTSILTQMNQQQDVLAKSCAEYPATIPVPPNFMSSCSQSTTVSLTSPGSVPLVINALPLTNSNVPSLSTIVPPSTKLPHKILDPGVSPSHLSGQISSGVTSALLAPAQLFQLGVLSNPMKNSAALEQPLVLEQKLSDVSNAVPLISTFTVPQPEVLTTKQLLPLPKMSTQQNEYNKAVDFLGNANYMRRGSRGRGNETVHALHQFTEDFDFTAMNEKFNKDEVWGELGKGECRGMVEEQGVTEGALDDDVSQNGQSNRILDPHKKNVYVKDDFFDSFSSDVDRERQRSDKSNFSERRKIDTKTFGRFSLRSRGRRGGSGGYRGGFRAPYNGSQGISGGRGNGYTPE